jgi:hypothetical protein
MLALNAEKDTIEGTDGTDDVHVLVTVEDAAGKPISNSPAVMLTIESGPGEFPTGRKITFDGGTDIPIRDGQAAIEFRSYFGGPSVIRARSAGLKDAVLTITTHGEPMFAEGKSPIVADRPYVPVVANAGGAPAAMQDVAANRPTEASSEAPGHNASLALDGDPSTYWAAMDAKPGVWWQVDLEQPHTISSIHTTFPKAGNFRYRIEGSPDGNQWTLLVDNSDTQSTQRVRTDEITGDPHFQFVRITFTALPNGEPAAIADVKIDGKHWP